MKAQRFQVKTNTSAILMSLALRDMASEVIDDHLAAHEFDSSFDMSTNDDVEQVNTWPDDDFDYFDYGIDDDLSYSMDEQVTPTEELWEGETSEFMPKTGGVELLRWLMEGVKASEIKNKSATWVALRFNWFCAMIVGAHFDKEIFDDPSQIIGRYSVALESRLREFGIEFVIFGGIIEAGYQRLNEIKQQEFETV